MMTRETRYELVYAITSAAGARVEKVCYPRSEEQKNKNLDICRERGYEVVSCKKLYPFNTERTQHNFMLISNICSNRMHDLLFEAKTKWTPEMDAEYDRLEALKDTAERLFCAELPVAWLTWEDLKAARELSEMAVEHRVAKCVEAGRVDLIQYC